MNLKKPKFWNYNKPNIFAYLLFPFSILVTLINFLKRIIGKREFKIKTICVGNFYVGGTGKTSLSIRLNKILKEKKIKSCFVKKYYKNQTDEQKILQNNGKLFLSTKRIDAIKEAENDKYEVAILDDGLQDHRISYDTRIVCFNTINWIGNGMTIPSGPLREKIENLKKYEHVFLNGNLDNLDFFKKIILKINPKINIYHGKYEIVNLSQFNRDQKYLVFSGIGNHQTFIEMIKGHGFNVIKDLEFPDHYNYNNKEINKIISESKKLSCRILTTEKDYLRLSGKNLNEIQFIKSELKIVEEEKLIKLII